MSMKAINYLDRLGADLRVIEALNQSPGGMTRKEIVNEVAPLLPGGSPSEREQSVENAIRRLKNNEVIGLQNGKYVPNPNIGMTEPMISLGGVPFPMDVPFPIGGNPFGLG